MTSAPLRPGRLMSIGEVLTGLRGDFPDVTISKIRFLESAGLVQPQRTASGYRKFSPTDVERLRYVLTAQRDRYLPLKVIREHLDAIARGLEPPEVAGEAPRVPSAPASSAEAGDAEVDEARTLRLSRSELLANSGLTEQQLDQLQSFGLIRAEAEPAFYDRRALAVAAAAARLATFGLEPRHLRPFKTAADREAGLIEQVVAPVARQRDDEAADRAAAMRVELEQLAGHLHALLVASALADTT